MDGNTGTGEQQKVLKEVYTLLFGKKLETSSLWDVERAFSSSLWNPENMKNGIETKIITFADKNAHQLFLEPEGVNSREYYVNGFSSSLPLQTQIDAIQSVKGLEKAQLYRPGYAIEYNFFVPTQL